MARLLTPELGAAVDAVAADIRAQRALDDERRPPLDRLAGEIAALEAWVVEAQASGRLPAHLPEIEAADRRVADAEGLARIWKLIGDVMTRRAP